VRLNENYLLRAADLHFNHRYKSRFSDNCKESTGIGNERLVCRQTVRPLCGVTSVRTDRQVGMPSAVGLLCLYHCAICGDTFRKSCVLKQKTPKKSATDFTISISYVDITSTELSAVQCQLLCRLSTAMTVLSLFSDVI